MTEAELRELVKSIVTEVVKAHEAPAAAPPKPAVAPGEAPPAWSRGPKHRPLPPPRSAEALERLVGTTPARIVTGRTGTRYLTTSYLGLRADHAIALDAVESEVDEAWATAQGWLALRSKAKDHAEFLLHPEQGRRLDDASRTKCEREADKGVDVQLIAGDGLSAHALKVNGPALMKALHAAHTAKGFRVGKPLFVKFARIGVQDEIGVLTQARSTIIIVGERPGLGTGDSLSIYTAFGPKLGQDNAEKDCISNVRAVGFPPERAALKCAELMKASFAAGGGGVKLTGGDPAFRPHVVNH
ncbi:MAG: ethanolamine ammonia-lyase subunit EutC [Myxococcota bacterium]